MKTRTPEEMIRDAQQVDAFLKLEPVSDALSMMERKYYEEFLGSDSAERRVTTWAKAHVLRDFEQELRVILARGETEALHAAKATASRTTKEPH